MAAHRDFSSAALAIGGADFLLFTAGAGASADSGLKVFADMSDVPAYKALSLTYDQIASADMLVKNPSLFYGFWFDALKQYQKAVPHEGYNILHSWKTACESRGGRVHVATSNVDRFFARSGFNSEQITEIHGSVFAWQCGGGANRESKFPAWLSDPCRCPLVAPPAGVEVDPGSMCVTADVLPLCGSCGTGALRPNVYLFGDASRFQVDEEAAATYRSFVDEAEEALKSDPTKKLVVVEIGCGLRVPSLRKRGEDLLAGSPEGQCELIRINPDYPVNELVCPPTIPLAERALAALQAIDQAREV